MGRIAKTDNRYSMLQRVPRVLDGRVVFRKKRGHDNKYVIAVFEEPTAVHCVLYRLFKRFENGDVVQCMSFTDYRRD